MVVCETIGELRKVLNVWQSEGLKIGLVPTMGALHRGHISLVKRAAKECDQVICTVFVNPTQFNDPDDLLKYPRDIDRDLNMLKEANCDLVFFPGEEEVYPNGRDYKLDFNLEHLDSVMEGEFRPGHFKGVAQVVHRFLELTEPQAIYMGLKDYQQIAVVSKLIEDLKLGVELVPVETVREVSGLALSSRNERLSPEMKERAVVIFKTLMDCCKWVNTHPAEEIRRMAYAQIRDQGLEPEYFELADPGSLLIISSGMIQKKVVACVAAKAGDVRLIDNMLIEPGRCYRLTVS